MRETKREREKEGAKESDCVRVREREIKRKSEKARKKQGDSKRERGRKRERARKRENVHVCGKERNMQENVDAETRQRRNESCDSCKSCHIHKQNYRYLLQNIASFIGLFCKKDLRF